MSDSDRGNEVGDYDEVPQTSEKLGGCDEVPYTSEGQSRPPLQRYLTPRRLKALSIIQRAKETVKELKSLESIIGLGEAAASGLESSYKALKEASECNETSLDKFQELFMKVMEHAKDLTVVYYSQIKKGTSVKPSASQKKRMTEVAKSLNQVDPTSKKVLSLYNKKLVTISLAACNDILDKQIPMNTSIKPETAKRLLVNLRQLVQVITNLYVNKEENNEKVRDYLSNKQRNEIWTVVDCLVEKLELSVLPEEASIKTVKDFLEQEVKSKASNNRPKRSNGNAPPDEIIFANTKFLADKYPKVSEKLAKLIQAISWCEEKISPTIDLPIQERQLTSTSDNNNYLPTEDVPSESPSSSGVSEPSKPKFGPKEDVEILDQLLNSENTFNQSFNMPVGGPPGFATTQNEISIPQGPSISEEYDVLPLREVDLNSDNVDLSLPTDDDRDRFQFDSFDENVEPMDEVILTSKEPVSSQRDKTQAAIDYMKTEERLENFVNRYFAMDDLLYDLVGKLQKAGEISTSEYIKQLTKVCRERNELLNWYDEASEHYPKLLNDKFRAAHAKKFKGCVVAEFNDFNYFQKYRLRTALTTLPLYVAKYDEYKPVVKLVVDAFDAINKKSALTENEFNYIDEMRVIIQKIAQHNKATASLDSIVSDSTLSRNFASFSKLLEHLDEMAAKKLFDVIRNEMIKSTGIPDKETVVEEDVSSFEEELGDSDLETSDDHMPPEPRRKGRTKSDDTFEVRSDPRVNKSNGTVSGSEQSEYSFAVANSEKYSKQKINMDDGKIASMRVVDFNKLQDPAYKAGKARRKLILEVVIRACDEALDKKNDPEFVFDDNNSDEDNAIAISALTIMGFDPKFSNNKDVEAIANLLEISQDKLGQEMEAIRSDISTYSSSSCRPNGDKMYEEFSDAVGPLIASETTSIREMRNATLLTTHSIFKHNPASPRDRTRSLPVVDPISSLKL